MELAVMEEELENGKRQLEKELMCLCASTSSTAHKNAALREILENDLDWEYVMEIAGRNGLMPLLAWTIQRHEGGAVPDEIRRRIGRFLATQTQRNLFLTLRLIDIVTALRGKSIEVICFKGPTLSIQAYKDLSFRQYGDLDILVKPKEFDAATQALVEEGYIPATNANWLKRKALFFTHRKDIVLCNADETVRIELHWKLSGSHFSLPVEINELWHRADTLSVGGKDLNVLAFDVLFVYLCLHGARHEWDRLAWLSDLNELANSRRENISAPDWEAAMEFSRRVGCERVLELGIYLIHHFFGTTIPYPKFQELIDNPIYGPLVKQIEHRIFSEKYAPSLKEEKYSFLLSLQEKRTHRVRLYLVYVTYYLGLLMTPNEKDKGMFALPRVLYPLYFILRPIRLAVKYVKPKGRVRSDVD